MGWDNQKVIQSFQLNILHQPALLKAIQEVKLYKLSFDWWHHWEVLKMAKLKNGLAYSLFLVLLFTHSLILLFTVMGYIPEEKKQGEVEDILFWTPYLLEVLRFLLYRNTRENKASPLETSQNCVTPLRNFKA